MADECGRNRVKILVTHPRRAARAHQDGMKTGALDTFARIEIDPQRNRGQLSVGALRSPLVNLVRTRLLEPRTVSPHRRMNTHRNVIDPINPGVLRSGIATSA